MPSTQIFINIITISFKYVRTCLQPHLGHLQSTILHQALKLHVTVYCKGLRVILKSGCIDGNYMLICNSIKHKGMSKMKPI